MLPYQCMCAATVALLLLLVVVVVAAVVVVVVAAVVAVRMLSLQVETIGRKGKGVKSEMVMLF